jgi:tetratricopeptide (TPR) repeat protein
MNPSLFCFRNSVYEHIHVFFEEIVSVLEQKYFDAVLSDIPEAEKFFEKQFSTYDSASISDLIIRESEEQKDNQVYLLNSGQIEILSEWASEILLKLEKLRMDVSFIDWLRKKKPDSIFELCFPLYFKNGSLQFLERSPSRIYTYLMEHFPSKSKMIQYTIFSEEGWKVKDIEIQSLCLCTNDGYYYNGRHRLNGRTCTVKVIHKSQYSTPKEIKQIDHELRLTKMFKQLKSTSFLRPYTCEAIEAEANTTYILVFEPIYSNLNQIISGLAIKDKVLSENQLKEVLGGICQSIIFLHEQELFLKDIATHDIFITADRRVILGNCRNIFLKSEKNDLGLRMHMPPELLKNEIDIDFKKLDSWIVGTFFLRLFVDDLKLEKGSGSKQVQEAVLDPRWRKKYPDIMLMIERFLEKIPEQRDTIEVVFSNNKNKFKNGCVLDSEFEIEKNKILELDSIALYNIHVCEYSQAIALYKKLHFISDDPRILLSLAYSHLLNGGYEEAKMLYLQALKNTRQGLDSHLYWNIIISYVHAEFHQSNYQNLDLISFIQQVCRKLEVIGIPSRPWTIFLNQMLSKFLMLSGQYSKALEIELKMLNSATKIYSNEHILLAKIYLNLGSCYIEQDQMNKALENLEKTTKIITSISSGSSYQLILAKAFKAVGTLYFKYNDLNKSLSYFSQAYTIYESCFGQCSPQGADMYQEFSKIYLAAKDYSNALNYFAGALDIYRKIYGESSREVVEVLIKIAKTKYEIKDYNDVMQILAKAEKIFNAYESSKQVSDSIILCEIYHLFGKSSKKLQDYKNANEYLNKCLNVYNKAEAQDNYLLSMLHDSRGSVFQKICDNYKALEEFERAYNSFRETAQNSFHTVMFRFSYEI